MFKHRERNRAVCPKIAGPVWKNAFLKWLFPITGLVSLVWFLVRVIPKPSRAAYPCQRAMFPIACSFITYLAGILGTAAVLRKAGRHLQRARYILAGVCIIIGLICAWLTINADPSKSKAADVSIKAANSPIGTAKGLAPGRVVWVRDPNAMHWDGTTNYWWGDSFIDQAAVDGLVSKSIRWLTGTSTDVRAWDALFRYYNQTHGRGSAGYAAGEKIAIKINLNNCDPGEPPDNQADAVPHTVLAFLRQLVANANVDPSNITVYDAVREIADKIFIKCNMEFPAVVFVDRNGGNGRTKCVWVSNTINYAVSNSCGRAIPQCLKDATYLINIALLKGHGIAGLTLTSKNHYGTVNGQDHSYIASTSGYNPLVDIAGHKSVGGKTMLFAIDGLYMCKSQGDTPKRASMSPFNGNWPSSLFVSQDPVAIDSVAFDFLFTEYSSSVNNENYLHEEALADNPPSGTFYDPEADGSRLQSLGVHEHWNNSTSKQYTRNLGTGDGIELVTSQPPLVPCFPGDINTDCKVDYLDLAQMAAQWLDTAGSDINDDGIVDMTDFTLLAGDWLQEYRFTPTVTVTASTATAYEGGANGRFTVSRNDTADALTVRYSVSGSATAGSDYNTLSGQVSLPSGVSSAAIDVVLIDDTAVETTEQVTVTLLADASYKIGSPNSAAVNIIDNDTPPVPVVTVTATDATAAETGDIGQFTVSRTNINLNSSLTVYYSASGTATAGNDYTTLSGSVTLAANISSGTITVTPVDDTAYDPAETVIISITANANYAIGTPSQATVTITDNETPPLFTEDFETSTGFAGWDLKNGSYGKSTGANAYSGTYGGYLKNNAWARKNISTSGKTGIHVKYARKVEAYAAGKYLYIEWSPDGSTWNQLESVPSTDTSWSYKDMACGSSADNKSGFAIRFRGGGTLNSEYAYIDNIEVTGN